MLKQKVDKFSPKKSSSPMANAMKAYVFNTGLWREYSEGIEKKGVMNCIIIPDGKTPVTLRVFTPRNQCECVSMGRSVKIINYIDKQEEIVATKHTKFFLSAPVVVDPEQEEKAKELVNPKPTPIKDIKVDTKVTVIAKVDQIEDAKRCGASDQITYQHMRISDGSNSVKVTAWRGVGLDKYNVGDWIRLKQVRVGYYKELVLNINYAEEVELLSEEDIAEMETTIDVTIDALSVKDSALEISTDTQQQMTIEALLFCTALCCKESEVVPLIVEKLPLKVSLTLKGNKITNVFLV